MSLIFFFYVIHIIPRGTGFWALQMTIEQHKFFPTNFAFGLLFSWWIWLTDGGGFIMPCCLGPTPSSCLFLRTCWWLLPLGWWFWWHLALQNLSDELRCWVTEDQNVNERLFSFLPAFIVNFSSHRSLQLLKVAALEIDNRSDWYCVWSLFQCQLATEIGSDWSGDWSLFQCPLATKFGSNWFGDLSLFQCQ